MWSGLRHSLDQESASLSRQARLIVAYLTSRYAIDDPHHPVSVAGRLAGDLEVPELGRRLALGLAFDLAALFTHQELGSDVSSTLIDADYATLADMLEKHGRQTYQQILSNGGEELSAARAKHWQSAHALIEARSSGWSSAPGIELLLRGDPLAVALGCLGACLDRLPVEHDSLETGLVELAMALIVERDIHDLASDIALPQHSVVVAAILESSDLDAEDATPELLRGALIAHDVFSDLVNRWSSHLDNARNHLPGLDQTAALLEYLENRLDATKAFLEGRGPTPPKPSWAPRRERVTENSINSAMRAGREFLLADPELREAWEVHRRGILGSDLVVARFPSSFTLESLARHDVDVAKQIDDLLIHLGGHGFSYYDHPQLPYVDADTVGFVLRIAGHAGDRDRAAEAVTELLALVEPSVAAQRVPLWLTTPDDSHIVLVGEGCGTVEANLLLGLARHDWRSHARSATPVLHRLLADFDEYGTGVSVNYPPAFLLVVLTRLLEELGIDDSGPWTKIREEIEAITAETPMTAALLALACSTRPTSDLYSAQWLKTLLDAQREDGSWPSEPLYFINGRGGDPTWYSSVTTTTALCWDALATISQHRGSNPSR